MDGHEARPFSAAIANRKSKLVLSLALSLEGLEGIDNPHAALVSLSIGRTP
jgi:hypothetical protein